MERQLADVRRLRVGQWLGITIGALLAFAAVGVGLALVANAQLGHRRGELLDRVQPSLRAAIELEGALLNEETGVRGYALSGQRDFLAPYLAGHAAELAAYRKIEARLSSTGARPQLLALEARAREWRQQLVVPTLRMRGATPHGSIALNSRGRVLFNAVRAALASLDHMLQARDNTVRASLDSAASTLEGLLIAAAALIAGSLLAAGLVLRRILTRPLARLEADAAAVAAGDFTRPLSAASGAREIVDLRGEIETMRARIVQELDSVQRAHSLLGRQAEELRRSNAELDQFASVAAHDLQEPLRKIASFCQALKLRYGGRLDERADEYIEYAVDGAKRMQVLITALHELARVGRQGARMQIELGEALAAAERSLSAELGHSGARIESDPLPSIRGDPVLMTSLFGNLLGNALKFRDSQQPVVRIGCLRGIDTWELSFADNGIGIEPQYAERIFQVFQRLHTREEYEGTGIGLALCRKIVEYHGGRIWLDPEHRGGARFVMTLPISDTETT
ncbi:MAG TPA: ATP-binding protein [Solirubrobacteraceae bacterium]|jgi:signal transduction histidine kinase|nr:ATP-binding protein [Solirubrobacteraceae bacterium]